jgi:1-deoxy-D-xylulose-5-phosphate synthase
VVAIYSTFLQRGYDQLIHDVAIRTTGLFALDRAGLVGADGATHAGAYDIPYLRCVPNMSVLTPADEDECRQSLYTAFLQDHPVAVRYPRGSGAGKLPQAAMTAIPFGKGEIRREHARTASGSPGRSWRSGPCSIRRWRRRRLDATVASVAKPLDVALVTWRRHDAIVTVEEGAVMGGAGSAVLEALAEARIEIPVLNLGLPDAFSEHGDPAKLLSLYGLDAAGIEQSVQRRFGTTPALVRSVAGV